MNKNKVSRCSVSWSARLRVAFLKLMLIHFIALHATSFAAPGAQKKTPSAASSAAAQKSDPHPTTKRPPQDSELVTAHAVKLLLIGDSLTAGYGIPQQHAYPSLSLKTLQEEGYEITIVNASVSGATSASGLSQLRWHSKKKPKPTHVLLALGSNDGLRGQSLKALEDNIEKMIGEARRQGIIPLLVGLQVPANMGAQYSKKFQQIFPALARKHQLPLWDFILKDVGGEPDKNLADGIHPNHKGHLIMAEYFSAFLREHLPPPPAAKQQKNDPSATQKGNLLKPTDQKASP